MTAREQINSRLRIYGAGLLAFLVAYMTSVIGLCAIVEPGIKRPPSGLLIAGAVGALAMIANGIVLGKWLVCPHCKGSIIKLAASWFKLPKAAKFCPFCGTDLDMPL